MNKKTHKHTFSVDCPGIIPGLSKHFAQIAWEFCAFASFARKRQHTNKFDPLPFPAQFRKVVYHLLRDHCQSDSNLLKSASVSVTAAVIIQKMLKTVTAINTPYSELRATRNYKVDIGNTEINSQLVKAGNCNSLTQTND